MMDLRFTSCKRCERVKSVSCIVFFVSSVAYMMTFIAAMECAQPTNTHTHTLCQPENDATTMCQPFLFLFFFSRLLHCRLLQTSSYSLNFSPSLFFFFFDLVCVVQALLLHSIVFYFCALHKMNLLWDIIKCCGYTIYHYKNTFGALINRVRRAASNTHHFWPSQRPRVPVSVSVCVSVCVWFVLARIRHYYQLRTNGVSIEEEGGGTRNIIVRNRDIYADINRATTGTSAYMLRHSAKFILLLFQGAEPKPKRRNKRKKIWPNQCNLYIM